MSHSTITLGDVLWILCFLLPWLVVMVKYWRRRERGEAPRRASKKITLPPADDPRWSPSGDGFVLGYFQLRRVRVDSGGLMGVWVLFFEGRPQPLSPLESRDYAAAVENGVFWRMRCEAESSSGGGQ